jgi:hypothetical protein
LKHLAHGRAFALCVVLVVCVLLGCAASKPAAQQDATAAGQTPGTRQTAGAPQAASPQPSPARQWFADTLKSPVVANGKYDLECVFKLSELGGGSGPTRYVEGVSVRDGHKGSEAIYSPEGGGAEELLTSQAYFADVWSPDGEYLVLPLGPSRGFCVIRSAGALKTLKRRRCDDFIRVLDYRPGAEVKRAAYYHDWGGWQTATAFGFTAGAADGRRAFVYDAARGELYDGERGGEDYEAYMKERVGRNEAREVGESARGRLEITKSFVKP